MSPLHAAAANRDDDGPALGRPLAGAFRPEAAALAAITCGYEDARARIIATGSATPAGENHADPVPEVSPPGWAPTVPVDLGSGLPRPPAAPAPTSRPRWRSGLFRAALTRLGAHPG